MSVEDKNVIDVISIDKDGNTVLTISDHLKWDDENEHLLILQDKINAYLESIEGGDLYVKYPNAENRNIVIRIISLNKPNKDGQIFLDRARGVLEGAGYGFKFEHLQKGK